VLASPKNIGSGEGATSPVDLVRSAGAYEAMTCRRRLAHGLLYTSILDSYLPIVQVSIGL